MIQPDNNPNKTFDYAHFSILPLLDKHQYMESLLGEKIKLTYRNAIEQFPSCFFIDEKLAASIENFITFKDRKFTEIPNDIDCLLYAAIDKFTGIFHLVIKNQGEGERSLSFYELDSLTQQLTHKGDAPIVIFSTIKSALENEFDGFDFLASSDYTIKNLWASATFYKTTKNATMEDISSIYPQWKDQIANKVPYVRQYFYNIEDMIYKIIYSEKWDDNMSFNKYFPKDGIIECTISAAHSKLNPDHIEEMINASRSRIKNSRSIE